MTAIDGTAIDGTGRCAWAPRLAKFVLVALLLPVTIMADQTAHAAGGLQPVPRHWHTDNEQQTFPPPKKSCPSTFASYGSAIAHQLDMSNGNLAQLQTWLVACGVQSEDWGIVSQYALAGVVEEDVVVTIYKFASPSVYPPGVLLVYHQTDSGYALVHRVQGAGMIDVRKVGDANADGRREIVWTDTACGASTCFSTLFVDQWDGTTYRDWILGKPSIASLDHDGFRVEDVSAEGAGAEVTMHGGIFGPVGAGPMRARTDVFGAPPGKPYELLTTVLDPTTCFYHRLLEVNKLFDQADGDPTLHAAAVAQYASLLDDSSLQACAYTPLPGELFLLRDFVLFRQVISYSVLGDSPEAAAAADHITTPIIRGAAVAFLDSFSASEGEQQDTSLACAAVATYAMTYLGAWNYLEDWGYGNPAFSAAQLCAGAGSISGVAWNDFCTTSDPDLPPSAGCTSHNGIYMANGVREAGEQPLGGVTLNLFNHSCSQIGNMNSTLTMTAGTGAYTFGALDPGSYCVRLVPTDANNASILTVGNWSQPPAVDTAAESVTGTVTEIDVTLAPGQDAQGIDFGWDYRFD